MRGIAFTCLAVAGVLLTPLSSAAVVANVSAKPIATDVVPTGTVSLTNQDGKETVVKPGESVDIPAGTYMVRSKFPGFWSYEGTCVIPAGGATCEVPADPIRPYQPNSPPYGGVFFGTFYEYLNLTNLPLESVRQTDIVAGDRFVTRTDRREKGQRNNFTNNALNMSVGGVEGAFGLPSLLLSTLLINSAIHGMLGGVDLDIDTNSRRDNRAFDRDVSVQGVGFGGGFEATFVSITFPFGARIGVTAMGGSVDGHLKKASSVDDGGAFTATDRDVSGSWLSTKTRFDLLFPVFRKVSPYVGANYRTHEASIETIARGTSAGGPTTRINQHKFRGDSIMPHAGIDSAWFSWEGFPPIGLRAEVEAGPCGCVGLFFKGGVMLGGNGVGRVMP